jgi:hypothetical protein
VLGSIVPANAGRERGGHDVSLRGNALGNRPTLAPGEVWGKFMSRAPTFLVGMAAGAALLYTAMNFYVMRAGDGFHLVAKQSPRLSETFVDIRAFSMADWASHPQLAADLMQAEKQYLVGDSAAASFQDNVKQLLPAWPKE